MHVCQYTTCMSGVHSGQRGWIPLVIDGCEPYVVPKSNPGLLHEQPVPFTPESSLQAQGLIPEHGTHQAISGYLDSKRSSEIKRVSVLPLQSPLER